MKKPKISIIVPIYNVEKYIKRCIDSLVNQTFKDIEIILVDDESPDNCFHICEEYSARDPRIKVIHKKNGGLGFARNSGLDVAIGEYIAFVDSDDYVDLNMYEKLYETAQENALDTLYCGYNNVDNNFKAESISEVSSLQILDSTDEINGVLMDMIASEPSSRIERKYRMSVWHGIYSNELITKNKIRFCSEREFISEDIIFHIDYLTVTSRIAFIPNPFYYYCDNESSLTKTFRKDRLKKHIILYEGILFRMIELGYDKSLYQDRVIRFFIGYVRFDLRGICNSDISFLEKKRLIKEICLNPIWESFINYPVNKMPLKHKVIMYMIKNRMISSLITLYRFI